MLTTSSFCFFVSLVAIITLSSVGVTAEDSLTAHEDKTDARKVRVRGENFVIETAHPIVRSRKTAMSESGHDNQNDNDDNDDSGAALPIFLLHGVTGSPASMTNITQWLFEDNPNRTVVNLDVFNGDTSWISLIVQVPSITMVIRDYISKSPSTYSSGYHLMCHSQGGIICRAIVQEMDDHKINTFFSLAGPLNGQYGSTGKTAPARYGNISTPLLYLVFYNKVAQSTLSAANYWRDNKHLNDFYDKNLFLPVINNMKKTNNTDRYTRNWLKTKKVAIFGSPQDGTIEPWISTQFGTWDAENGPGVVPMERQPIYQADTFGLRTMDERGDLIRVSPFNITHEDWVHDRHAFFSYVMPVLWKVENTQTRKK